MPSPTVSRKYNTRGKGRGFKLIVCICFNTFLQISSSVGGFICRLFVITCMKSRTIMIFMVSAWVGVSSGVVHAAACIIPGQRMGVGSVKFVVFARVDKVASNLSHIRQSEVA